MKAPFLILIFSGLIGLNKCSPELKTENPFSFHKHLQKEAIQIEKFDSVIDTLSITNFLLMK